MRDPFSWSIPLGRLSGIAIKVHLLFPILALGIVLRVVYLEGKGEAYQGAWKDVLMLQGMLFLSVLLHEFGHCFGARSVDGDAREILMWPLGGLAFVEVPHTPRANFITTAAGPFVNLLLMALSGGVLVALSSGQIRPSFNPFDFYPRISETGAVNLFTWRGKAVETTNLTWILLARFFWVNYWLFLFNVVLPGFPLDGGRLFQAAVWHYSSYRQGTLAAIFAGFVTMFVVGLAGIMLNEVLLLGLAIFIYMACKHELI